MAFEGQRLDSRHHLLLTWLSLTSLGTAALLPLLAAFTLVACGGAAEPPSSWDHATAIYAPAYRSAELEDLRVMFVHGMATPCRTLFSGKSGPQPVLQFVSVYIRGSAPGMFTVGEGEGTADVTLVETGQGQTKWRNAARSGTVELSSIESDTMRVAVDARIPRRRQNVRALECTGSQSDGQEPGPTECMCERSDGSRFSCMSDSEDCCQLDATETDPLIIMPTQADYCPGMCIEAPALDLCPWNF